MAWILKVYNDDDDDEIKDRQNGKNDRGELKQSIEESYLQ